MKGHPLLSQTQVARALAVWTYRQCIVLSGAARLTSNGFNLVHAMLAAQRVKHEVQLIEQLHYLQRAERRCQVSVVDNITEEDCDAACREGSTIIMCE